MDDFESVLFVCREVNVYKVPTRTTLAGYKAQEWGDLAEPLWKGRMRIIETSKICAIRLEDANSGDLFAQSPYDHTGTSVESVLDSSRYFVLRVEDEGRKAYIGIGFPERPEAFDFHVALQDYTKRQKALLNPSTADDESGPSPHIPAGPKKDYSLKEGQTFSISIPGSASSSHSSSSSNSIFTTSSNVGSSSAPIVDLLGGLGSTSTSNSTSSYTPAPKPVSASGFPLLPPPPSSKRK